MRNLEISITTNDIIKKFDLSIIAGAKGIHRPIVTSDISRPGLEIAGYFTYYPRERVQVIGKTEITFMEQINEEILIANLTRLAKKETPAIIITRNLEVPSFLIKICETHGVPLLRTSLKTTRFTSLLSNFLETLFAPTTTIHGELVDVYGVGVLLTGKSGVGKSEVALELVKRGHRLVADDRVDIRQEDEEVLIGYAPDILKHLIEIRGLGILNVMTLFGVGATRNDAKVEIVMDLEFWQEKKEYDRLGLGMEVMKIMDVEVPKITIPVRPGRNLAVIIEVAAMNYRQKGLGINSAEIFQERLTELIIKESK